MDKIDLDNIDLTDFIMPIKLNYDREYYFELKGRLNSYKEYIKNLNDISQSTIENVEDNINLIVESVEDYYNADIVDAKDKIINLLKKYTSNDFIVSDLDRSYAFRGLAPFSDLLDEIQEGYINNYDKIKNGTLSFFKARLGNSTFENFSKKDMLHIPFCNRELVSTQRFSVPGVPCLYLGTTSYVCWLEMDKPQDSIFNVSSFILPKHLKILNLVIDNKLIDNQARNSMRFNGDKRDNNIKLLECMIEVLPLVYATSFSIKNKERKFKSEYIVSQLIMQCLSELKIDGIAYASKKVTNSARAFPQCINLAIPMKINKKFEFKEERDNYADICENILLTEPVNLSEFQKMGGNNKYGPYVTLINKYFSSDYLPESLINLGGRGVYYKWTQFADFDNYIINSDHKKADIFNIDRDNS